MSGAQIAGETFRRNPSPARLTSRVTLVCVVVIAALALVAIFAPVIAPYDPVAQSLASANLDPSRAHWLGTDQFGRDILSRIIYGTRTSLLLGLISPLVAGNNPWRYNAKEFTALLAQRAGDTQRAGQLFRELADDATAPQGIRARAAEMSAVLGS